MKKERKERICKKIIESLWYDPNYWVLFILKSVFCNTPFN